MDSAVQTWPLAVNHLFRRAGTLYGGQEIVTVVAPQNASPSWNQPVLRCAVEVSTNQPPDALLVRLKPPVRGWCAYFRPGCPPRPSPTCATTWCHTVWGRVRRKHLKTGWKKVRSHYGGRGSWWASDERSCSTPPR
jgi:hypothetical protein